MNNTLVHEVRLTRSEVARHLNCSVSTVIRYEKRRILASHKMGPRMVRFWPEDVLRLQQKQAVRHKS